MTSLFALVDCNNFYCSVMRVFHPELNNVPVVVLSNNDGSIIARSNEAKALGLQMGQPFFEAKSTIDKYNVVYFSSNYTLIGDMSARVHRTLARFTPNMEIYSIDEAFLDLGGFKGIDIPDYARTIRNTVKKWTGIPVSIGVAPTKTLAKLANRIAKKSEKANGVLVLTEAKHLEAALKRTDISDVWGIGSRYATKLHSFGINNAWQLANVTDAFAKKHLTVVGLRLVKELRGEPCTDLEIEPPAKKGICSSRSFGQPVTTLNDLKEAVAIYASRCAYKLRQQKSACRVVTVFIHTNPFREQEPQYYNTKTIYLPVSSSSTIELVQYATMALEHIYRDGFAYKKAGVYITEIGPADGAQMNIFDRVDRSKHASLMLTLDQLNRSMGKGTVKVAAEGVSHIWEPKAEFSPPCYTTRIEDVLKVR
ncbi:Y-family DNA polymerase [uncultured Pontibacter sp.]|uniref:Y-family DNA polymerase n=1 Tax=uncultured Pontibacter sp. TaxID=453356 RepID=UPI00260E783A|nr:Y-family DNA polymerase [uncultured Pontibacter sp.]